MEFPSRNAAAQRVLGIAALLKKMGFIVILHGLNKDLRNGHILSLEKEISGYRVYESSYPSSGSSWVKFIVGCDNISSIIMKYGPQNIHAIIAYNYPAVAMTRMIILCSKFGINFVSDCSEWYGPSNRKFPSMIFKNLDTFLRMRVLNSASKNIICISDYLEAYYKKKGCHTVNIPSLVDNNSAKWAQGGIKYIPNNPRSFLYLGSPGKSLEKDRLDYLINVFHKFKIGDIPFIFNIIGITNDAYLRIFPEHRILIEDLKSEITFHGKMEHEDAIKFLTAADYSIFCRNVNRTTSAGFPTKIAESFACGTPVITNPTSNISRYILDGKNGYIAESCSETDLYSTVLKALRSNDKELEEMHSFCLSQNPLDINNFYEVLKIFMYNLK